MVEKWTEREIEIIWGSDGYRQIRAVVKGDFAVHRLDGRADVPFWVITHLPTGSSLTNGSGDFRSAAKAKRAAEEIQKLRSDWKTLGADQATPDLAYRVRAIAVRHGAVLPLFGSTYAAGAEPNRNGYVPTPETYGERGA